MTDRPRPIRATCSATAATRRTPAGRATRASPCSSSSTTRKAARTACCTATPAASIPVGDVRSAQAFAARHLTMESIYEYGSRVGVWRILREFERARPAADGVRRGDGARAHARGRCRLRRTRPRDRLPRLALDPLPGRRRGDRARAHRRATADPSRELTGASARSAGTPGATARTRAGSSPSTAASSTTATTTATTCRSGCRSQAPTARVVAAPRRALHARLQRHALRAAAGLLARRATSSTTCATLRRALRRRRPDGRTGDDERSACTAGCSAGPGALRALQRFLDHVQAHERVWVARRIDIARHWRRSIRSTPPTAFVWEA